MGTYKVIVGLPYAEVICCICTFSLLMNSITFASLFSHQYKTPELILLFFHILGELIGDLMPAYNH